MKVTSILFSIIMALSLCSCQNNSETSHEDGMAEKVKIDAEIVNNIDPVCGMEMPKYMGDTLNHEGDLYGFCSAKCKHDFQEDPEGYISKLN
ncbi:MAG: YHS domain-containing protein [Chitinophagales bacterium]|nr:YHS domain-containing protein [Chitinophagales bacterium]